MKTPLKFTHGFEACGHQSQRCPECRFRRRAPFWQKGWLACRVHSDGSWGVGCTHCAAYAKHVEQPRSPKDAVWSKFKVNTISSLQASHIAQHERSQKHTAAALHHNGKSSDAVKFLEKRTAPSQRCFRKVLDHVRSATSRRRMGFGGGYKKAYRMIWAMAEAQRDLYRKWLRSAHTIALHQDKGKSRLVVRFTASCPGLTRRAGFIGVRKMTGGANAIIAETAMIMRRFCTPGSGKPPTAATVTPLPEQHVDAELWRAIRRKIHLWNADGAADCQLAGRLCLPATAAQRAPSKLGRKAFPKLRRPVKHKVSARPLLLHYN